MEIRLKELETGKIYEGQILEGMPKEMPLKKDGWNFTWKKLARVEGAMIFKITLKDAPKEIEGLLMLTLVNDELVYMDNIELAPHNYGSKGKFKHVAGSLIAFACAKSFDLGKGHYVGFLSFESKTQLISLYQEKYGASIAMGRKMFIDAANAKRLIKKYLNIEIKNPESHE